MNEKELEKLIVEIVKFKEKIDSDPEIQREIREKGEYYQKKYGTLTEKELSITITI